MKHIIQPVGHLLTTAALSSAIADPLLSSAASANMDLPMPRPDQSATPFSTQADHELIGSEAATPTPDPTSQEFSSSPAAEPSSTQYQLDEPVEAIAPEQPTHAPDAEGTPESEAAIVPDASPAEPSTELSTEPADPALTAAQELLAEKLAALVDQDRPQKLVTFRHNLTASALYYAESGDFERARQTAQNPALSPEAQAQLLAQIDEIEEAQAIPPEPVAIAPAAPASAAVDWTALRSLPAPVQLNAALQDYQRCIAAADNPTLSAVTVPQYTFSRLPSAASAEFSRPTAIPKRSLKCKAPFGSNDIEHQLMQVIPGLAMLYPLPFQSPITSRFGWRIHPITGDRRFHQGVDLGAPFGTPVLAAMAGRVELSDFLDGYGITVILEHNEGSQKTLYAHLSGVAVQPGTWVEPGMVIGWVGSTGHSTGPHLHFEVQQNTPQGWLAIDPLPDSAMALARPLQ